MDIIISAIEKKYHICSKVLQHEQNWENFKNVCNNKKIFLFGTGSGLIYCMEHFPDDIRFSGAIDNDEDKQNYVLSDLWMDAVSTEYHDVKVFSLEYLNRFQAEDVVVLITSTKFYENMINQLEEIGIKNIFVLLLLEVNNIDRKIIIKEQIDFIQDRNQFVQKCSKLEINKKKIVISYGVYGGHGRYITRQLLKERNDLDIVWIVNDINQNHPDGVRLVSLSNWKKYIYDMETAGIWIYDIMVPNYIVKRPEQKYIQVKHWSSITLKNFYLEDESTCGTQEVVDEILYNARMMDYVFTGSKFDEDVCERGFGVKDIFSRIGSPRSDVLFVNGVRERVIHNYGLCNDIKCILYAPTFRETERIEESYFNLQLDCQSLKNKLEERFGEKWVILLRLHPLIAKQVESIKFEEYIINASEYEDSQELVAASDIVITDYSSLMFEPAFVKKPVFLFAPDKKTYIGNERQLLIDYDRLPFAIAESNDELMKIIDNFNYDKYIEELNGFMKRYEVCEDGQASKRAVKIITKIIDEK